MHHRGQRKLRYNQMHRGSTGNTKVYEERGARQKKDLGNQNLTVTKKS